MGKLSSLGTDTYPTETRGDGKRKGVTNYYHCIQCGFLCNALTTSVASEGDGLSGQVNSITDSQVVTSGCPNCGSLQSRRKKLPRYPDDRFLPTKKEDRGVGYLF